MLQHGHQGAARGVHGAGTERGDQLLFERCALPTGLLDQPSTAGRDRDFTDARVLSIRLSLDVAHLFQLKRGLGDGLLGHPHALCQLSDRARAVDQVLKQVAVGVADPWMTRSSHRLKQVFIRRDRGQQGEGWQIDGLGIEGGHGRNIAIDHHGCTSTVVDMKTSPIEVARAFYEALEGGKHGDALRPLLTEDVVVLEHPNWLKPRGGRSGLSEVLASSSQGAQLLSWQRYEVREASEHGDTAILRVTWTAEIARTVGPFQAGQRLTAHLAQFVTCRGGQVARIETYDCYEVPA